MNRPAFRHDGHLNQWRTIGKLAFPAKAKGEREKPGMGGSILPQSCARVFHETLNHTAERPAIDNMLLVY